MAENDSDKVVLKLKRPLADGSTTLEMTPITLLKRLAGLVPRPRSRVSVIVASGPDGSTIRRNHRRQGTQGVWEL